MKKKMIYVGFLAILFLGSFPLHCTTAATDNGTPASSAAARYVADQVKQQNRTVAVYTDFGDGLNCFTQRAALNPDGAAMPEMDEKAPSPFGVSSIKVTYPLKKTDDWNGFMFMTGRLAEGSTAPEIDFGDYPTGYDLRGAKRLKFKARGEIGGERVQFYMGGLASNDPSKPYPDTGEKHLNGGEFVTLSTEWKDYTIDLNDVNLSRIASGFGWVSNEPANSGRDKIVFYLDEIVYEFDQERSELLFLRSHDPVPLDKEQSFINNFAYIYDNALSAMVLARSGELDKACQIADAFVYAAHNDRYYTYVMLRNAYFDGPVRSFPGWLSSRGKEFARIPGFFSTEANEWWEDRYGVSINTGNIAWSIMALIEVYRNAPQKAEYLETAQQLGDYVIEHFKSPESAGGGFTAGYEGWEPAPISSVMVPKLTYKSTEHAIDLYVAYKWLAELAGNPTDAARYKAASLHARDFMLSMYDPERGCFYTGTTTDGKTINKDNLPLDTNTWGILALHGDKEANGLWDLEKTLRFIQENFKVNGSVGYDFNNDRDGVWFEGTAQYAVVLDLLGKSSEYTQVLSYMNQAARADGSITAADRDGVTTGFSVTIASSTTPTGLQDIPWLYNKRGALGATCWLALAQLRINPYSATGNTPIETNGGKASVWSSSGNLLHILAPATGKAQVYTIDGALAKTISVSAGETQTVSLPVGYYVVKLNDNVCKVLVH